jgi:D-inositol-3-phosphate glycosyltransferase
LDRGHSYPPVATGAIDHAARDAAPDGAVVVRGWTLARDGVARVELNVGARAPVRARLGLPRPDVAAVHPAPEAEMCGWECSIDIDAPGPVTLSAAATTLGGERVEIARRTICLEATPRSPPPVAIPIARRRSGRLRHVLFVTHDLARSGAPLSLVELVERLRRERGLEASVLTCRAGVLEARLAACGVDVHFLSPGPDGVRDAAAWAAEKEPDVALLNSFFAYPGAAVADRLQLPIVWALRELWSPPAAWGLGPGAPPAADRAAAVAALGSADAALFPSEAARRVWSGHVGPAREVVVRWAPAPARPREASLRARTRAALEIPASAQVVLCLGWVEPHKGQAVLARAFAHVASDHPAAMLVIAGAQPNDYVAALERWISRSGLARRIVVVPLVEDPGPLFAAADAFALTSDVEALGRVLVEAAGAALPTLATRAGGMPEVVVDGVTGLLCEPNDVASVAAGLGALLSLTPERRAALVAAAQERVRREHDPDRYLDSVEECLAAAAGADVEAVA